MKIGQLIKEIEYKDFQGDPEEEIMGLAYDSRTIKPGDLFVALKGDTHDGHEFMGDAIRKGAVALVAEKFENIKISKNEILVHDSKRTLSKLAVAFFNSPFDGINLIGITGTNGKTTTSYLLESILLAAGAMPGVIGTINYRFSGHITPALMTTPQSLDLMKALRQMADGGATDIVMEVSSHALDQGRTEDCPFRLAIFTNLSRDHLDYHHSMESYFQAKSLLFRKIGEKGLKGHTRAAINFDDPWGRDLAKITDVPVVSYGLNKESQVSAKNIHMSKDGLSGRLVAPSGEIDFNSSLIGDFNVYNILAASAGAYCLNLSLDAVTKGVAQLKSVPGRLEPVKNRRSLSIVVDYAHTPDALLKAVTALRPLTRGRLITVFGCGGDRDKGKRKEMGLVAGKFSDLVLITSDNPRTEDPFSIISQIEEGIQETGLRKLNGSVGDYEKKGYMVDPDRRKAIWRVAQLAGKKDLILIAGKGHEDYQIVGKEKRDFDDRIIAAQAASNENINVR